MYRFVESFLVGAVAWVWLGLATVGVWAVFGSGPIVAVLTLVIGCVLLVTFSAPVWVPIFVVLEHRDRQRRVNAAHQP